MNLTNPDTSRYPWLRSYPDGLAWDSAIEPQPLWRLMDEAVERFPDRIAIDFLGHRTTYRELGRLVDRAARGLVEAGLKPGAKVGLFLPNTPYFVVLYYAVLKAGGTVVNFNPLYAPEELRRQVEDSETEIMATLDLRSLYDKLLPLVGTSPLKKLLVCSMGDALPMPKRWFFAIAMRRGLVTVPKDDRHVTFEALTHNAGNFTPASIDPRATLALLQYTGGTTGRPKGAMLTHANVYINARQCALWFPRDETRQEKMLGVLPLFHVFAMTTVMNWSLTAGATMILLPRFDLKGLLQTIKRCKPTGFAGVPTLFNAILNHPKIGDYELSSLVFCISGGAALPVELARRFEALSGAKLVEGYGLSECSPVVCCNLPKGPSRPGSIGLPYPATVVEIRATEAPHGLLPLGEHGELCVRGPQVMKGYWKQPEETAAAFIDGAFRTGDVGYIDAEGFCYVTDRLKDMINAGGYKIYPRLVEEALYAHPDVADCAVIGVPDPYRGQTVKAFVVPKPGHRLDEVLLADYLKHKLSPIELPKIYAFPSSLPKTAIGKIDKKLLVADETPERRAP